MAVDGTIHVDAVAERPRNPVVSTRFSLIMENEQADERRDGRICLAKSNSQARMGKRKKKKLSLFS